jgi:hypothetical protein
MIKIITGVGLHTLLVPMVNGAAGLENSRAVPQSYHVI